MAAGWHWVRRRWSGSGSRRRRLLVIVLVALTAVLVGTVVATAMLFPTVAATTCPACYGMRHVGSGIYIERNASAERRRQVADLVVAADQRVRDFYGSRESSPRILACTTADCYHRIGGGAERGVAVLNRAIILSPRGLDPVILSHEMSHVELHQRLGSRSAEVPQWFDEGLAVVVSNDPRYLQPPSTPDRCTAAPDGALPQTLKQWLDAASADEQVYARSACQVVRWLDANGGRKAILDLIERLTSGDEFGAVVTSR